MGPKIGPQYESMPDTRLPPEFQKAGMVSARGRRALQDDRHLARSGTDGWLTAVADDVSGTSHPATASSAAVRSLPGLVESQEGMLNVFEAAHKAVCSASDAALGPTETELRTAEITTLAVAGFTPSGGLHIGWVGDTLPFLVPLGPGPGWHGAASTRGLPRAGPSGGQVRPTISWWLGGHRPEVWPTDRPFRDVVSCLSISPDGVIIERGHHIDPDEGAQMRNRLDVSEGFSWCWLPMACGNP